MREVTPKLAGNAHIRLGTENHPEPPAWLRFYPTLGHQLFESSSDRVSMDFKLLGQIAGGGNQTVTAENPFLKEFPETRSNLLINGAFTSVELYMKSPHWYNIYLKTGTSS